MITNDLLGEWDRKNFMHPSTHLAQHERGETVSRIMSKGSGCYIQDRDGNKFLDGFAGLYCVNVGYGRTEISDAIAKQANELAYYHSYVGHGSEAAIKLSKMVIDRAPKNMSKVYFGLSGSDANETNIKLLWYYNNILGKTKKKKIISRHRGYHGSGLMTGSLTGLELFHKKFDLPLDKIIHTESPYFFRRENLDMNEKDFTNYCAQCLEQLIDEQGADTIAAFIAEPILGTGGIVPPPKNYWKVIMPILERNDILLIADEVVTGFGRLGNMFGSDHYNMRPDFITIAKGLTSAYSPLSGSIVSKRVWEVLSKGTDENGPMGHGWTYSAHPIGAAAGVANLELIDRLNLLQNAKSTGKYLNLKLSEALKNHSNIGDIRGEGMISAIEFVAKKSSREFFAPEKKVGAEISKVLGKNGVIGRAMPQGDILGFAPPLSLSKSEADIIVDAVKKTVKEVFD